MNLMWEVCEMYLYLKCSNLLSGLALAPTFSRRVWILLHLTVHYCTLEPELQTWSLNFRPSTGFDSLHDILRLFLSPSVQPDRTHYQAKTDTWVCPKMMGPRQKWMVDG